MTKDEAIQKVINIAKSEVGYLEKKNGNNLYEKTLNTGSNNYTKYGYEMHKIYPNTMDYPAPWCDCFCDWCFVQAFGYEKAVELLHGLDDYTVNSANSYKKYGEWHTTPRVGDQIFFTNAKGGICHTGLVYKVESNKVHTIEGNTSSAIGVVANGGAVAYKSYSLNYSRISGYGRPNYDLVKEELTVGQYNELKSLISEQQALISELKRENTEIKAVLESTFIYNWVDDNMPEWAKTAVTSAMNCGAIKGDEDGKLNLSYKDLRNIVREYRQGIYDKPCVHK